jgi:hypothetical protein
LGAVDQLHKGLNSYGNKVLVVRIVFC